ncbi:hypothetical protein [Microvirga flavescens]|uniref:hypothetical protein n=1 Tax=Microvirga flavescens TaxID=2249811 RepID=UPI000DDBDCA6|nr:hypothetical protein [Microvirga flavescens]
MHLVQILLPMTDPAGHRFSGEAYGRVRTELAGRFGGVTSFTRARLDGARRENGHPGHGDVAVFEIMTRDIDHTWWEDYRAELERRFEQEAIVVRALKVEML